MHRKNKQTKAILKNEDNTSGEEKDDSDGDGSSVDDNNHNNDENPSDIVDSVDEPTDDKPESLAPIESIPSLSPSDPFKTELIDATNNNESGGSSNGGSTSDANNNNNNNSSSMLTNNSDVITSVTNNNSKSKLDLSVDVKEDPIVRGNIQTIQVTLSDDESGDGIDDANVEASVEYTSGEHTEEPGSKTTDSSGHASFSWKIGGNSYPGTFTAIVQASKNGYDSETKRISFEVIPKGSSSNGGNGDDYDESNGNSVSTDNNLKTRTLLLNIQIIFPIVLCI